MPIITNSPSLISSLTVTGDLTVEGQTLTMQSSTLTVDDKNIEMAAVAAVNGMSTTTNLVQGQTDVIVESTTGLIPGMTLTKASGAGAFNAGGATIAEITDSTTFVASAAHATAGAITFNVGGATAATANGGGITLKGDSDKIIHWQSDTSAWESNQHFMPSSNNQLNLGGTSNRWANVYTGDLHLANDRGDWTLVEEENYLTIRNNKNGKRYKLLMEELPEDEE